MQIDADGTRGGLPRARGRCAACCGFEYNQTAMDAKHIFISYCHEDAKFASLLKDHLEDAQLSVWMDLGLRAGEVWGEEIDEAIRGASALVVILSPRANASWYVNYECAFALGTGLTVVPLLLRLSPEELPPRLATLQALDFRDPVSRPWAELLSRLKDLSGSPRPARKKTAPTVIENAADGLNSLDADERLRAIATLKQTSNPEALEILAGALGHAVSQVRIEAAFALLEFQDARAIPVLLESVVANREEGRWNTNREQVRRLGPAAVPAFLAALRHPDPEVRRLAASGLEEFEDSSVLPALTAALSDPDWGVRSAALHVLGKYGPDAPVGLIVERLGDEKPVRWTAAIALGEIGGAEAVRGLMQAINDPDWDVRYSVIRALGKARHPAAVPALVEVLKNDRNFNYRGEAADALGAIGDPSAVVGLVEATQEDEDDSTRGRAFDALVSIGGPPAVAALREVLRTPESEGRSRAANALGKLKDPAAVPDLLAALSDQDRWVRKCAVGALGEIKHEAAVTGLTGALCDEDTEVRSAAADVLGNIGSPAAVPALVAALKDSDEQIRRSASRALEEIHTPEARAAVRAFRRSKFTSA